MASAEIETVNTGLDKAKIAGALALVVAGLAGFYLLSKQGGLVQWLVVIGAVVAAVALFLTSEPGKEFVAFCRDAKNEVKKVVWPTPKEAGQMTAYVFAFVVVMSLVLFLIDLTLDKVLFDLLLGWRK